MGILSKLKPEFWDHYDVAAGVGNKPFSFRRKWKLIVFYTSLIALIPLMVLVLVEYRLSRSIIETDAITALSRQTAWARNTATGFFSRQRAMVAYILLENSYEELIRPDRLGGILKNLNTAGYHAVRISILDDKNRLQAHAGPPYKKDMLKLVPEKLQKQRQGHAFFCYWDTDEKQMLQFGIAVRNTLPNNGFFTLIAQIDKKKLESMLSLVILDHGVDFSILNRQGNVIIPSRYNLNIDDLRPVLNSGSLNPSGVVETTDDSGSLYLAGYTHIQGTPFVLFSPKLKSNMVDQWLKPRLNLVGFFVVSIFLIFLSIMGAATYLVNLIHTADHKRIKALHQVEYTNKLASIGMLASGVAHEINNPLDIINQKTGLIKDLFTLSQEYAGNPRVLVLIDDILAAVDRCGSITKRLLNFAQHMKSEVQQVNISDIVHEVIRFVERDAERRCIGLLIDVDEMIPEFEVDRGNLQQILLNLFNNAFAAMAEGGQLEVHVKRKGTDMITVMVRDNGCGIPPEDLKRVFDPFFSTSHDHKGTGLGLSITYGLVKEIGGDILVESTVGKGTRFTIEFSMNPPETYTPEADACLYVEKAIDSE